MSHNKTYTSQSIQVHYDSNLCIHAAECVRGLPEVFDTAKKPWIDPAQAQADAIAEVIHKCPSGALTYRRLDGGPAEAALEPSLTMAANGPLYLRGTITLSDTEGQAIFKGHRVALCRCGKSQNKPFCDRSHSNGFEAPKVEGRLT